MSRTLPLITCLYTIVLLHAIGQDEDFSSIKFNQKYENVKSLVLEGRSPFIDGFPQNGLNDEELAATLCAGYLVMLKSGKFELWGKAVSWIHQNKELSKMVQLAYDRHPNQMEVILAYLISTESSTILDKGKFLKRIYPLTLYLERDRNKAELMFKEQGYNPEFVREIYHRFYCSIGAIVDELFNHMQSPAIDLGKINRDVVPGHLLIARGDVFTVDDFFMLAGLYDAYKERHPKLSSHRKIDKILKHSGLRRESLETSWMNSYNNADFYFWQCLRNHDETATMISDKANVKKTTDSDRNIDYELKFLDISKIKAKDNIRRLEDKLRTEGGSWQDHKLLIKLYKKNGVNASTYPVERFDKSDSEVRELAVIYYDLFGRPTADINTIKKVWSDAAKALSTLVERFPESPKVWAYKGLVEFSLGKKEESMKSLKAALDLAKEDEDVLEVKRAMQR